MATRLVCTACFELAIICGQWSLVSGTNRGFPRSTPQPSLGVLLFELLTKQMNCLVNGFCLRAAPHPLGLLGSLNLLTLLKNFLLI